MLQLYEHGKLSTFSGELRGEGEKMARAKIGSIYNDTPDFPKFIGTLPTFDKIIQNFSIHFQQR